VWNGLIWLRIESTGKLTVHGNQPSVFFKDSEFLEQMIGYEVVGLLVGWLVGWLVVT
jgi:NhaP-type Na+/H+ or K+/H+ antiporter